MTGICVLGLTACGGSSHHASRDHGLVVADLAIPPASPLNPVVQVAVKVGQRFSVKIDTSDGPLFWNEVGPAPDRHLVRPVGDFNDGHCAPHLVGCRVPYFHTLLAKAKGTTVMSWHYTDGDCQNKSFASTHPDCSAPNTVKFEITVT